MEERAAAGGEPAAEEEPPAKRAKPAAAAGSDDDEGDVCCKCHSANDGDKMLLCGPNDHTCSYACHIYCMDPPLKRLPKGDWFCPECKAAGHCGHIVLLRLTADTSTLQRGWDICRVTEEKADGSLSGVWLMPEVSGSEADWPEGWEAGALTDIMAEGEPWKFSDVPAKAKYWGSTLKEQDGKKWCSDPAGLKCEIANLEAAIAAKAAEASRARGRGSGSGSSRSHV